MPLPGGPRQADPAVEFPPTTGRIIPVSAVIPTRDRRHALLRMLESLGAQAVQPAEIVVVDASDDPDPGFGGGRRPIAGVGGEIRWLKAVETGAAAQRNQAIAECRHRVVAFFDDDIVFEPDCVGRLWRALQSDDRLGGVNAMITNQRYHPPGRFSRSVFAVLAGQPEDSYAGRVIGPAVNLLPEDRDDLPDIVLTDWLNTTCTFYRREALPDPVFGSHFTGYSLMEDLALSLAVARGWKLANVRSARIYHDSQPGAHKSDRVALSRMELVNRHYVMREVLGRVGRGDMARLSLWELFQLAAAARQYRFGRGFWQTLQGKWLAVRDIRAAAGGAGDR